MKPQKSRNVRKAIEALGFKEQSQRGSHHFFKTADGKTISLVYHGNEDIGTTEMSMILRKLREYGLDKKFRSLL